MNRVQEGPVLSPLNAVVLGVDDDLQLNSVLSENSLSFERPVITKCVEIFKTSFVTGKTGSTIPTFLTCRLKRQYKRKHIRAQKHECKKEIMADHPTWSLRESLPQTQPSKRQRRYSIGNIPLTNCVPMDALLSTF